MYPQRFSVNFCFIDEFKRKKNKQIQKDFDAQGQLIALISFWRESLTRQRILYKLTLKL